MNIDENLTKALSAQKEGKFDEAEKIYQSILKIQPANIDANYYLGILYVATNKHQASLPLFKKTILFKPNFIQAQYILGITQQELGNFYEASICFDKVLELNPNFSNDQNKFEIAVRQNQILSDIKKKRKTVEKNINNISICNPFMSNRVVEEELINYLYKIKTGKLDHTPDGRYGNGICSDFNFFQNDAPIIKTISDDLIKIMSEAVMSDVYVLESFFNIMGAKAGTTPHSHASNLDIKLGFNDQKYSFFYYVDIGNQNCDEPGILKLHSNDKIKEILPTNGMILVTRADQIHSSVYNGDKDRIMIGANFYSLL